MRLVKVIALFLFASALCVNCWADTLKQVGSGSNEAILVIDWDDGKTAEPITWKYCWEEGAAVALHDMLNAIIDADSNLFGWVGRHPQNHLFMVMGLGYDLDGDAEGTFSLTSAYTSTDEDDYAAGGPLVWNYWSSMDGSAWNQESTMWIDGDQAPIYIANGGWVGFSTSMTEAPSYAGGTAVVPEPATGAILLSGLLMLAGVHAKRGKKKA